MKEHSRFFKRVVRPYFFLLMVVISVAIFMVYSASSQRIKIEMENNRRQLAEKTARQLDTYIEELDMLANQVKHQPKILNFFYKLKTEQDPGNHFDKDILNSIDISSALKNLLINRMLTYNITVYNDLGDFVSSQEYNINKNELKKHINTINATELTERLSEDDSVLVMPPNHSKWINGNEDLYITLIKALKNDYSEDICGIIEVRCNLSRFEETMGINAEDEIRFAIRDRSTGSIIYPIGYDAENITNRITAAAEQVNWEIMMDLGSNLAEKFSAQLLLLFIIIYIVLMGFIMLLTYLVGRHVTKPLSELTKYVRTINNPNTKVQFVNENAIDEVTELEDSFEKMLSRMKKSIKQEKKAYSLALQAQMNPHFLYNTLAVIGSVGAENNCDTVTNMCKELSDMLRYVTEYQTVTVPLKRELEHTTNYLSLMKSRYEDYFEYTIDIDENLLEMPVPKLFIQPLVENSFKHGFRDKEPPWKISLCIKGSASDWKLVMRDNGSGISDDRIVTLKNNISNSLSEMLSENTTGIGLVNTIVRLKMTHNENLEYEIYNDNGMVVMIKSKQ